MATNKRGQGEGSIYRRKDGRWAGAVTLGYRSGKRGRKTVYGRTRRDVQQKVTKLLSAQQDGLPIPTGRQTVERFLIRWLKVSAQPRLRPRTFEGYEQIVERHLIPTLGKLSLQNLTPQHVQQLLTEKSAAGLSPRRVGYIRAVLRTALNQALRWNLVGANASTLVDLPRVEQTEAQALNPDQARCLLIATRDHRLSAFFSVAMAVGLRLGEALGLMWDDVELDRGTLTVRRALQRITGHGRQLVEPKSRRSFRTLTLPGVTVEALRQHRVSQQKEQLVAGGRWRPSHFVFTTTIGTPLDESNIRKVFVMLLTRAGLPRVRLHDLRHTCASLLLAQGVDPRTIMEILGHSQISLTLNTYTHISPSLKRDAAEKMDALLGGG